MKKALQNSLKADGLGLGLKIVFAIAERHRVELKFSRVDRKACALKFTLKRFHNEVIQTYACRPNRR